MGIFISPEKPGLFLRFVKEKTVLSFEERRRTTFSATKFINNNNKQGFTPSGTNNEYVRVHKRVQDSNRW